MTGVLDVPGDLGEARRAVGRRRKKVWDMITYEERVYGTKASRGRPKWDANNRAGGASEN
jgi:hypothetical protein